MADIPNDELIKLTKKKQQILRLQNGRFVSFKSYSKRRRRDSMLFLDPGKSDPKPQQD